MTSQSAGTQSMFLPSSHALYRAAFGRKGATNGITKAMVGDTRAFPSLKRKCSKSSPSIGMTSSAKPLTEMVLQERRTRRGILSLTTGPDGKATCACIRATQLLQDAWIWVWLESIQELMIEDEQNAVRTVPQQLCRLRHLRHLSVRWSSLQQVSPELATMPLTHLRLRDNKLQSVGHVVHMDTLTVLDLAANHLRVLPEDIGNLKSLQTLDLSGNMLTDLPASVGELTALRELELAGNSLCHLPATVGTLHELRQLDASRNRLVSVPATLGDLRKLTTCVLSNNQLSTFPDRFGDLTELRWLLLGNNKFNEIPAVLFSLPALEVLNMNQNCVATVPEASSSVKHLLLDDNVLASFPIKLVECRNLLSLHLERNGIRQVPAEIQQLSRLRVLRLGGNAFDVLPEEVGELSELRQLMLNDNRIEHLPERIECLQRLNTLKLDNTQMDGGWMVAYREGIPAVMRYSRTVKLRVQKTAQMAAAQKAGHGCNADLDANAVKVDMQAHGPLLAPLDGVLLKAISEHGKPVEEIDAPQASPAVVRRTPTELPATKAGTPTATPKGSPVIKALRHLLRKHPNGSPASGRRPTPNGYPASGRRPIPNGSPVPGRRLGVLSNGTPAFASNGSPRLMRLRSSGFSGVRRSDTRFPPIVVATPEASLGSVTSQQILRADTL